MRRSQSLTRRTAYRVGIWISMTLVVALLALDIYTITNALSRSESSAPLTERRTTDTEVNPYGVNLFLEREVEAWKREKTLSMAADAGIGWVKLHFPWEEIEPIRKGENIDPTSHNSTWAKFDQIVSECERYGLRIVARLDRPPEWSRTDNSLATAPPDDYNDYGDFVYEFVRRYRGRIQYIQIWNEPNIYPEWGNSPVDPAQYVELLRIAYQRAKEADPTVKVLSAPLAYTLGQPHPEAGKWISMNDLDYLEGMYAAGAKDYFDICSVNAFGFDRPPEDPPDPEVLNFQRVVLQRQIMEKYGDSSKAVWFNEFGWNAAPAGMDASKLIWQRVTEEEQAEYTVRAVEMAQEEWPWAGVFFIWYFRQVGNITPDQADYYFRMVDVDFTTRAVYTAIQKVADKEPAASPGIYQESDALLQYFGDWQIVLDAQTSENAYRYTSSADASVSFNFVGSRLDILTRLGPLDGRVYVWVDDKPVAGLEQVNGNSVLNLNQQDASFEWITVWKGDEVGRHTVKMALEELSLQQSQPTNLVLDAIRVADEPSQFPWLRVVLIGVVIIVLLALCCWLRRRLKQLKRT
ncbi:MAG: hypothetical protein LLG44_09875 [Chloroflexi bacterium]|nr:hypothetical protein [Chloroflexota bacterium]